MKIALKMASISVATYQPSIHLPPHTPLTPTSLRTPHSPLHHLSHRDQSGSREHGSVAKATTVGRHGEKGRRRREEKGEASNKIQREGD